MTITREQRQEWGRKGGRATAAKYGSDHFRQLGVKGYQTTCDRHFGGDGIKCQNWLGKTRGMPRLNKKLHDQGLLAPTGLVVTFGNGSKEVW